MSLLLAPELLEARRLAAAGPLAPLAESLAAELAPLHRAPPVVPREKARLTRAGGTCPRDGARLAFDPWSPDVHRCPRCGGVETGAAHYRAWLMWQQLWLAERAVHGALMHLLRGDDAGRTLASTLLARYADCYLGFPNQDNVLGPARVFFSTYLESIWLLQVCVAIDLLERAGAAGSLAGTVRDRVIEPAVRLVASFDEGASNRQVWNDVAMLAAGRLLGDEGLVMRAVDGPSGLITHLTSGLLPDGSWYEGENYHMFAHRGLWYGLTIASAAGIGIPQPLVARFDEGFATPWLTALPDATLPSRRDAPHAVSLRQWRVAEMAELGLARSGDERLRGALATLYAGDIPRRDTGRSRSTADSERNEPPSSLTRADLGWRSLLHALPSLGELRPAAPRSALLEGQGLAVLRRDAGRVYTALDYGHSGGGHGHPDRLNVVLCDGATRWLDDPGTGSYVDPSLHWYRSTLAHNAPVVDGRSQRRVAGTLLAHDDRGDAGWVDAAVAEIAPGVLARRTLIAVGEHVIDVFAWQSGPAIRLELPLHADGEMEGVGAWEPAELEGAGGLEDGFDFIRDAACARFDPSGASRSARGPNPTRETRGTTSAGSPDEAAAARTGAVATEGFRADAVRLHARAGEASAICHLHADPPAEWWRARAPGPPGAGSARFHLARWTGTGGRLTTIWDLRGAISACDVSADAITVHCIDGSTYTHRRSPDGWTVDIESPRGSARIHLGGIRADALATVERAMSASAGTGAAIDRAVAAAPREGAGLDPAVAAAPRDVAGLARAVAAAPHDVAETGGMAATQHSSAKPSAAHEISEAPRIFELGERHYRRSELGWADAGQPSATVGLRRSGDHLCIDIAVRTPAPVFAAAGAANEMDNEHPDVNGDGVQLHVHLAPGTGGAVLAAWMAVPDADHGLRLREIAGSEAGWLPEGSWHRTPDGYAVELRVPLSRLGPAAPRRVDLDVLVNETRPGRERRRGQLLLSGSRGEWVYLRGDRQLPDRYLPFLIPDA